MVCQVPKGTTASAPTLSPLLGHTKPQVFYILDTFQPACHVQIEPWLEPRSQRFGEVWQPPSSPAAVAVPGEGVAAAGTVAGAAAVGTKAPVAGEAVVTAGPCHPGLAGTVAGAGVTEGAGAQGEHSRSHGVAGASCRGGTP